MSDPEKPASVMGVSVERRQRNDASISVGKWRIRLPQWMFWVLISAVTSFTVIQVVSILKTGKPVPIKGIVESRSGSYSNRVNAIEARVSALEQPK